jgi:2-methylisocitrate lyase-like PEP mutase family enzyme
LTAGSRWDKGGGIPQRGGPRRRQELRRIGREFPRPLAVNLIEGGRTPLCSLEELVEMGFYSRGFVLSGLYAAAPSGAPERTF